MTRGLGIVHLRASALTLFNLTRTGDIKPVLEALKEPPCRRTLAGCVPLRDVQEAASHADPRTTMRYDRARGSLDRHATCIVAADVAGAAR